ncbi:Holliday junction resolvase RecU [Mycoplasma crocodyli]|uniref:Holliday junction resolvase RecU n=1 Tax=Mycoplasma crocodyli (strain ATCC 51981 / MP145) TaxID=512564 RepID=D5E649_MYCCM|nr:Holliday junction resolvase RecU [Mycoplasma crocodyli]ADE19992.1 DNA recombination endonuclease U [Mycoplasma crocodyli MP145]
MHKNRGMLLETLINKTINYYWTNNIAYIEKKQIPITFKSISNIDGKLSIGNAVISSKSTVDYIGCYNGSFVAFEAKSTNIDKLELSNIKEHQIDYLKIIYDNGGFPFFVIFFSKDNKVYILSIKNYLEIIKDGKKYISQETIKNYSINVEITFPGIIDFLPLIKFIF